MMRSSSDNKRPSLTGSRSKASRVTPLFDRHRSSHPSSLSAHLPSGRLNRRPDEKSDGPHRPSGDAPTALIRRDAEESVASLSSNNSFTDRRIDRSPLPPPHRHEGQVELRRSYGEILQEVMRKSKAARAEKAEAHLHQSQLVEDIDSSFAEIRSLLKTKQQKEAELIDRFDERDPPLRMEEGGEQVDSVAKGEDEDLDHFIWSARQLANDARLQASDRVKSAEELAQEQKQTLERLERARLKRMEHPLLTVDEFGMVSAASESNDGDEMNMTEGSWRKRRRNAVKEARALAKSPHSTPGLMRSDDDLGVNFELCSDSLDNDDHQEGHVSETRVLKGDRLIARNKPIADNIITEDIPFVFAAPESFQHLWSMLNPHPMSTWPVILERMVACHSIHLSNENRHHMEIFCEALLALLDHVLVADSDRKTRKERLAVLNCIASLLANLLDALRVRITALIRTRIQTMLSRSHVGLTMSDIIVLHLALTLYPSSDYRHSITTPSLLLLSRHLQHAPLNNDVNLSSLLFACTLVLNYSHRCGRLVPELWTGFYRCSLFTWDHHKLNQTHHPHPTFALLDLLFAPLSSSSSAALQMALFAWYSKLVIKAIDYHRKESTLAELLALVSQRWKEVIDISDGQTSWCISLYKQIQDARQQSINTRAPLALSSVSKPLRTHAPSFHVDYQPTRSFDPVKERAKHQKLKKEALKEKKSAEKFVRHAAAKIAIVRDLTARAVSSEMQQKRRREYSDMERQAADSNVMQKKRKRIK